MSNDDHGAVIKVIEKPMRLLPDAKISDLSAGYRSRPVLRVGDEHLNVSVECQHPALVGER
jgi:hypothetical protein